MLSDQTVSLAMCRELMRAVASESLLRFFQNKILNELSNRFLFDNVLDFGGGEKSKYRHVFDEVDYTSINIDSLIAPSILYSIGEDPFVKLIKQEFDLAISFNTLEHLSEPRFVLEGMFEGLKPGGVLVISTPFLHRVHGHPDDYLRYCPSWFNEIFKEIGFTSCEVIPLYWGPFSLGASVSGLPGPFKVTRLRIAVLIDALYLLMSQLSGRNQVIARQRKEQALGYVAIGLK